MTAFMTLVVAAGLSSSAEGAAALTCKLDLPAGGQFGLKGHFDEHGLHSNLAELTQVKGAFAPAPPDVVITSDGTKSDRWQFSDPSTSQKVSATLSRYGERGAAMIVERHKFVGRHWGRDLIGVVLCNVRRAPADE